MDADGAAGRVFGKWRTTSPDWKAAATTVTREGDDGVAGSVAHSAIGRVPKRSEGAA